MQSDAASYKFPPSRNVPKDFTRKVGLLQCFWPILSNFPHRFWFSCKKLYEPAEIHFCAFCCRAGRFYKQKSSLHCCKLLFGAADRNRTGTLLPARDFKSLASASSATTAHCTKKRIQYSHPNVKQKLIPQMGMFDPQCVRAPNPLGEQPARPALHPPPTRLPCVGLGWTKPMPWHDAGLQKLLSGIQPTRPPGAVRQTQKAVPDCGFSCRRAHISRCRIAFFANIRIIREISNDP